MDKKGSTEFRALYLVCAAAIALGAALAVLQAARAASVSTQASQIGLITDPNGLLQGGFNKMAVAGLERAVSEFGIEATIYTTTVPEDFITQTQQCASDGNELCIGVGFLAYTAISDTAYANPGVKFAILDTTYERYPDNLQGILFATQEPSYVAGTLAGLMTQSDRLGIIGGMQIPPVDDFINGFVHGALCANPDVTTTISYTNDFSDPLLGAEYARDMIDAGADVIFPVAGPTGNGAILTTTQQGVWALGVDTDQWVTLFQSGTISGSEKLLTSVMKHLDNAVYTLIFNYLSGTFISGTVVYDLETGGVGLASYHEADPAIPDDVKAQVERARRGILAGTIDVNGPCPAYIYLPMATREELPGDFR